MGYLDQTFEKVNRFLILIEVFIILPLQAAKEHLGKEGIARCTFEDKILMSDTVFFNTWIPVEIPCFFNRLTTSLQP